jgi:DNA-binding transcriptional regulator LsrR (DeoR family)
MSPRIWKFRKADVPAPVLATDPARRTLLTNEPIVNQYFETLEELDEVLAERCRILADDQDQIRAHTLFEWHHN